MDWKILVAALVVGIIVKTLLGGGGKTSSEDARELVASGATLLDVRTPGEYAGGHIDGALNIPVQQLGNRVAEVPKDQPVVVYCQSGGRSARAAALLKQSGYDVHDLGGMSRW